MKDIDSVDYLRYDIVDANLKASGVLNNIPRV